ncbi:MAG TPA: YdcF family protein [Longimicrobiaceae bacterium]|nr:YdcF family protein [Longimicrobiaceae bacterium]
MTGAGVVPARRGWWRHRGGALLVLVLLALSAFALRAPILTGAARFLAVRDPVARADFILVLGGERYHRPRHAAELFRRGTAPRIVLIREASDLEASLGLVPNGTDVTVRVLRHFGVPDSAIRVVEYPGGAGSTAEEGEALRDYLRENRTRRVIVVTSEYHGRRARWTLRRATRGMGAELRMSLAATHEFNERNWWMREKGLVLYLNEYIKLFFYLARLR